MGESLTNVEEEEEESLESEISTVETNLKNPVRRAEQEREDSGHAVYSDWCAVRVKGRCVEKHLQVEPLKEEEKDMDISDYVFSTQENAETSQS